MTHYIPPFTRNGPHGSQQALCGVWALAHSTEPQCANCKHLLEAEAEPAKMPALQTR